MKGYVIQKLDNEIRYYEILGEEKGSPIIGESPTYTAKFLSPIEKAMINMMTKEDKI